MPELSEAPGIAPADYEFIAKCVYRHSRIRLGPNKQALVSGRLAPRLRALGLGSYSDYCQLLASPAGAAEFGPLVDVISTNHTLFFREPAHLDFLRDRALPVQAPALSRTRTPFRIWSAACSTGEEPYTLAIVIAEFVRTFGPLDWRLQATDISTRVLARAREGIYPHSAVQLPAPELLPRYFQRGVGEQEGLYRVKDILRAHISFHHLNLLEGAFPLEGPQHVIFCRNVMIYFDVATQQELVARLSAHLVPGGYLIVGASESLTAVRHTLSKVQPAIFQKPLE